MSSHQLAANGHDLMPTTGWCWLEDFSSLAVGPGIRGSNVTVPRLHGDIRTANKRYTATELVLPFWVKGIDPATGAMVADSERQLSLNIDRLKRIFAGANVQLVHSWDDEGSRILNVELAAEPPTVIWHRSAPAAATLAVPLVAPEPFWADEEQYTQELVGPSGTSVELTEFADATAPMTDLLVTFLGPISNPLLVHGDRTVQWHGVIPAGRQLVLNTTTFQASAGTGTPWSPDLRQVEWAGGPNWFELDPTRTPFEVELSHTGGGAAAARITAARKYFNP
ncbi:MULTISPECIES: hypothetical protein [Pseudonocardia]|uniref:Uncharacterized protein n=2 Tax=Pseudonocardia TaxID=1847 RepID=A0A1Y2N659_PSEAH|nr:MULTISPECIES: hypothetical protein [Pseudonocardia]OSY42946.1 hypothetical protein BG845_01188 [Pseudonocardia autotrophica]TDN77522.1 hypothetical protein C8E95_6770 [Pseudonocardia autotrophica]BBG01547.1 hypothetical protein Pdca_27560 [Pseudonocardia autotrophica]GEC25331.1 hypothetical protein PSA01_23600 [Pseudonocardia saturnea]